MKDGSPRDPAVSDGIDLRAVIGTLRRRFVMILTTMAVVTLSAAATGFMITPQYTATSTVMIAPSQTQVIDLKAVAGGLRPMLPGDDSVIETEVKLIQAGSRAQRIIEEFDLAEDPEFNDALPQDSRIRMVAKDWIPEGWLIATGIAEPREDPLANRDGHPKLYGNQEPERHETPQPDPTEGLIELDRLRMMVQGNNLSMARLVDRSAEFVPDYVLETKQGSRTDEGASEWGDVGEATVFQEEESESPVVDADRPDRTREALIAESIPAGAAPASDGAPSAAKSIATEGASALKQVVDHFLDSLEVSQDWIPEGWLIATGIAEHREAPAGAVPASDDAPSPAKSMTTEGASALKRVVDHFLDSLEVRQEGKSDIISVSFDSTSPEKAAQIVNAVVQSYIGDQVAAKVQVTAQARQWVAQQSERLREQVLEAESAVEAYRAAHDLIDSASGSLDSQQLASLNAELVAARAERTAKEVRLRRVRELREQGRNDRSLTEVASSPVIASLRADQAELLRQEAQLADEYGPRHPLIRQVETERARLAEELEQEIGNIMRNLENEVTIARAREMAFADTLEEAKGQTAEAKHAAIQLRELEREAAAKRSVYENFLTRSKEIQEQHDLLLKPDAKVISSALVPDEPSFPNVKLIVGIGLITSLMLGTGLAALAEHLDQGLRTAPQIEEVLGLPCLGLVPRLDRLRGRRRPHRYLLDKPLSAYAEAVKEVHMALQLSQPDAPSQVVLVTSTLPHEGKTTLSMSLGASLARSGRRTLVMDLDVRHPSVARELDEPVRIGLVEFMAGGAELDSIIQRDPQEANLDLIPVVSCTANPTGLLSSRMLQSLLVELRGQYDHIILDVPPALGTTDATVASRLADAVLFVVRWQATPRSVAINGLRALAKMRVAVAGVVLTQVDLRRHAKYGYGDVSHYYGEYQKYYLN